MSLDLKKIYFYINVVILAFFCLIFARYIVFCAFTLNFPVLYLIWVFYKLHLFFYKLHLIEICFLFPVYFYFYIQYFTLTFRLVTDNLEFQSTFYLFSFSCLSCFIAPALTSCFFFKLSSIFIIPIFPFQIVSYIFYYSSSGFHPILTTCILVS